MRVETLRIGNLLEHDGIIREVSSLHSDNTLRFKDENSSIGCFKATMNTINPIEITEEILLKCGFEKFNDNCFMINYNMQCQLFIFSNKTQVGVVNNINVPFYYMFNGLIHTLQYLHQLQNLYFALTNQELTINL